MSGKKKKLSVDDKTYDDVAGYKADMIAHGFAPDLGDAACELIAEGLRSKRAGLWDAPFTASMRNAIREVAEADRIERAEELGSAFLELEERTLEVRAAAYAVLLAQGLHPSEIARLYEDALALAAGERRA